MADPWCKVWWDWYTTRSHIGVGGDALYAGTVLMQFGKASPCDDEDVHWVLHADGRPVSHSDVAQVAQKPRGAMRKGLARLVDVGTLMTRPDGAYGFDRKAWSKYQPTSSGERMRRHRERHGVTDDTASPGDGVPSREKPEARSQKPEKNPSSGGNTVHRCAPNKPPLPPSHEDPDWDDPEVRMVGTTQNGPDFDTYFVMHLRQDFVAKTDEKLRKNVPAFSSGPRHGEGVDLVALDPALTRDEKIEVVRFALRAGTEDPKLHKLVATMFHGGPGGGFGAWVERWRNHEAAQESRARAEAEAAAQEKRRQEERQEAERLDPSAVLEEVRPTWMR